MDRILSYYVKENGRISEESLIDHIKSALKVTEELKASKIGKFADKLCDEVDFQDLVRLSIIFHDVGKVFYQSNFVSMEGLTFLSFRGHEQFSTYIFEEFRNGLIEQDLENCKKYGLYKVCTFSIYYHHHAMNVRLREPYIRKSIIDESIRNGLSLLNSFKNDVKRLLLLKEDEIKALEGAVEDIIEKLGSQPAGSVLVNVKNEVNGIKNGLWRDLVAEPKIRKLSFLSLSVLLAADYSSAQKRKSDQEKQSIFKRTLDDFCELYLTTV